jgi:hypothetical protein
MAFLPRTINQIQTQIQQTVFANSVLGPILTSQSLVAYWILWTFIMATCTAALEQIMLIFWIELENIVAAAVPGTAPWIQAEVLLFEYGNTVAINSDFSVNYPIPNILAQVVSQCAVVVGNNGVANIKVTGASGPLDGAPGIAGPQCVALETYLDTVLPAGLDFQLINALADTLQVNATVYYNGQSAGISTAVIAALNAYMAALPFNGIVKISDIEKTILGVPGVTDVVFANITATPNGGAPVQLITASATVLREYQTYAGYIINSAAPNDFATTLNFVVANS